MKKIICLLILLVSVFSLFGCSASNQKLNQILEKGEIVIITSPDYAPFEFIDESKTGNDKYVGADIELMKFIASELGVKLKIEVADFNTTLASLSLGTVDLAISGYTYKAERADNYEMSEGYYDEGRQGILILKEELNNYGSFKNLNVKGIKVGAQAGSLQVDYLENQLTNLTVEQFDTIPNGIALLDNKIIKGIALAEKVAEIIISKHPDKYLFLDDKFAVNSEDVELFAFAKKGEIALINKVNEIINKVKEQNLYQQWDKEASELAMSLGLL